MDFYYQIKGKTGDGEWGKWSFPPIFSGKVTANDIKQAKTNIAIEYGKQFPSRVLEKDLDSNEFLMSCKEIKPTDLYTQRLFEPINCKHCNNVFTVIEKYNNWHERNKGNEYCSQSCKLEATPIENYIPSNSVHKPVIYLITNNKTGMVYIGKTTQPFTLRWYQHFFQHGKCKFHEAIRSSHITEWTFKVLELVEDISKIDEREHFYITHYDSKRTGYNSVGGEKEIQIMVTNQQALTFEQ